MTLPAQQLRVAAAQAEALPGEVAANAATAARLGVAAADRGADLVVLPELFLPAYHPPTLAADPARCDVVAADDGTVDDPRLDALRGGRVPVLVGASVRRPDGRRTIAALLVEPAGAVRAVYDKQHLWDRYERALFDAGDSGCTLGLDSWQLGLGICYDGCFPEHGRAAALDGAHAYLCPSAYVDGSQPRRDIYYAARALDNTMYVVFANEVGGDAEWSFCGGAAIYGPQGQVIERAPDRGEVVIVADLDPAELRRVRAEHPMLLDRRDDLGGRTTSMIQGPLTGL